MSDLDEFFAELSTPPGRAAGGVAVDADLQVVLTTASGTSTTARITGGGQQVRIDAQRPEVLLGAVDRTGVGRVAELLAATGITVALHGPHGPVAALGAGTSDRLGRVITGSRRVAPAPLGAVRLVWAGLPARMTVAARPAVLAVSAAIVVLAAIGRLLTERRRRGATPRRFRSALRV